MPPYLTYVRHASTGRQRSCRDHQLLVDAASQTRLARTEENPRSCRLHMKERVDPSEKETTIAPVQVQPSHLFCLSHQNLWDLSDRSAPEKSRCFTHIDLPSFSPHKDRRIQNKQRRTTRGGVMLSVVLTRGKIMLAWNYFSVFIFLSPCRSFTYLNFL